MNPMKSMFQKIFISAGIIFLLVTLNSCAPGGGNSSCSPNVIEGGYQLKVSALSSTVFSFQLCTTPSTAGVFTVYGATLSGSLDQGSINVNASWRNKQITDARTAGAIFQVTFNASDNYFALYMDHPDGMGGYLLSNTTQLVSPHALPR
jgi:hypothetical protein